jgi:hypothetical protein
VADVIERGTLAEAGDVFVPRLATLVAAPSVVSVGDLLDVNLGRFAVDAIDQRAQLASVDEQHMAAAVAEPAVLLVVGQEPQAARLLKSRPEAGGPVFNELRISGDDNRLVRRRQSP